MDRFDVYRITTTDFDILDRPRAYKVECVATDMNREAANLLCNTLSALAYEQREDDRISFGIAPADQPYRPVLPL